MPPVSTHQRFTKERPCPVCGGYDQVPRGQGERCFGFLSDDGEWAHCTRSEHAGGLQVNDGSDTYAHFLAGDCRCGKRHGPAPSEPKPHANNSAPRRIVAEYDYRDETGDLLFQTVRYHPKDFRQRRPDGKGQWIWDLAGVRRILFELRGLIAADPAEPVFIPEGEEHVKRLRELGLIATTNPMGAGSWRPEYAEWFQDRHAVILPDNDDPGRRHAAQVAQSLYDVAKSVRVLMLPGLPEKGDVINWHDDGHTVDELVDLARNVPEWTPAEAHRESSPLRFQTAAEIARETPEEPEWISKPWLPAESITEVDGKIKVAGKTTFLMALARKVLEGLDFMGEPTMKSPVVYLTEQPRSSLREALRRADLLDREDFHILRYHDTMGTPWKQVVEAAAQKCKRVGARLLVVDTLPQFAGLRGESENSTGAALEALEPIQAVAAMGVGVIVVRHDGKADRDVGDSGRGSSAWGGVADIIVSIRRGEGNSSPTLRVLHSLSRFDETPDKLVIDLQDGEYVAVGTATQVALLQAREAIMKAAPTSEADAKKGTDLISEAEGVKTTVGKEAIAELLQEGKLDRHGTGKRNHAFMYWAPELIESEPPVVATETVEGSNAQRPAEQPELIESPIRVGVATQSIELSPEPGGENSEGRSEDLGDPAAIHSVGTPTLYTTESIKEDIEEV